MKTRVSTVRGGAENGLAVRPVTARGVSYILATADYQPTFNTYNSAASEVLIPGVRPHTHILSWQRGFGDCRLPIADYRYAALGGCLSNRQEKQSGHEGCNQGNGFVAMLAEEFEVSIGGADYDVRIQFGQPDDAGIGEVHRGIGVAVQQGPDWSKFSSQRYQGKTALLDKLKDIPGRELGLWRPGGKLRPALPRRSGHPEGEDQRS